MAGTVTITVSDEWQRVTPANAGQLMATLHGDVDGYCSFSPATPAPDAYGHALSGPHINLLAGDPTLSVYVRALTGRAFKMSYEAA